MLHSARFYLCARRRRQVIVCRGYDRGQRYCSTTFSRIRRSELQLESRRRYATSRAGRHNNAERHRRLRARRCDQKLPITQIVTDQSSALREHTDTLEPDRFSSINGPISHQATETRCHICAHCCDPLIRSDFLAPDCPASITLSGLAGESAEGTAPSGSPSSPKTGFSLLIHPLSAR